MSESKFAEKEREILKFWEEKQIFQKSLDKKSSQGDYVFYDGPPFATGLPHYGHFVASIMKDVVPRYFTMRGFKVERKWGWDCHGLPIENIVEKELGFKSKKDILEHGVDKFNEACRSKVLEYAAEWEKTIPRLGRWADMKNPYKTMDLEYMESIWWVFKQLWDKGLIYQDYKSMHVCPRCETTLSQQEVSEGYKDIKDLSVTAKFELVDEPGTFVLAWTTTPWTLPGNVALAVGPKIKYVKVKRFSGGWDQEGNPIYDNVILSKDIYESIKKDDISLKAAPFHFLLTKVEAGQKLPETTTVVQEFDAKYLLGKKYKPLFNDYENITLENKDNIYQIVQEDFVTTEDGTGVVHIAPAFGGDDYDSFKRNKLPFIQHVRMDGIIKEEIKDLAGLSVKPIDDHTSTDVQIIKYLAGKGLLFSKEKYEHSYPHCWRCDTPLINYATSSWFVNVTKIHKDLLKQAKPINWSPEHIKEGRFGKWLEGARDWSISRQRFWASVMPIWKCEACSELHVYGSVAELEKDKLSKNRVYAVRHGESEKNIARVYSCAIDRYPLTAKGQSQIIKQVKDVKKINIDLIFSSEVLRAKQSAEIIAKELDLTVVVDARLNEVNTGKFEEQPTDEKNIQQWYEDNNWRYPEGESANDLKKRMFDFYSEINTKYEGKNILIVSHEDTIRSLNGVLLGLADAEIFQEHLEVGELLPLKEKVTDLHKHIIDKVTVACKKCGKTMHRVPDVLDTWFDSGSMPYAQMHYPFENEKKFEANFPAEFIAEGLDQTRAWFYYLHVISVGLENKPAFKNVIVNGIVLAEDGKKMSKKLKNYPDPNEVIDKYGSDALRYYILTTPVMEAENLNFSENAVKENLQKNVMLLGNILSFYQIYQKQKDVAQPKLTNILDQWILAKLNVLLAEVTEKMEAYEIVRAARPLTDFINELSTWYVRRSRERFRDGDEIGVQTLGFILQELSKIIAPFMPFMAEAIYQQVSATEESVHLEAWPKVNQKAIDEKLLEQMDQARKIVERALAARAEAGMKIRQPLLSYTTTLVKKLDQAYIDIVLDELNIKELKFGSEDKLETQITPELKLEGQAREIIRQINNFRKESGFSLEDKVKLYYSGLDEVFAQFGEDIKKATYLTEVASGQGGKTLEVEGGRIGLEKI